MIPLRFGPLIYCRRIRCLHNPDATPARHLPQNSNRGQARQPCPQLDRRVAGPHRDVDQGQQ